MIGIAVLTLAATLGVCAFLLGWWIRASANLLASVFTLLTVCVLVSVLNALRTVKDGGLSHNGDGCDPGLPLHSKVMLSYSKYFVQPSTLSPSVHVFPWSRYDRSKSSPLRPTQSLVNAFDDYDIFSGLRQGYREHGMEHLLEPRRTSLPLTNNAVHQRMPFCKHPTMCPKKSPGVGYTLRPMGRNASFQLVHERERLRKRCRDVFHDEESSDNVRLSRYHLDNENRNKNETPSYVSKSLFMKSQKELHGRSKSSGLSQESVIALPHGTDENMKSEGMPSAQPIVEGVSSGVDGHIKGRSQKSNKKYDTLSRSCNDLLDNCGMSKGDSIK